jgi:hypothetical protein
VTLACIAGPAAAGGLRCSVGEVVIDNLRIGASYSLTTLANVPLAVTNTDHRSAFVRIEPLVPDSSELRNGAEPLPDVRWASAWPETLELPVGEMRAAEMRLDIPNDPRLLGRKFQVFFWTHTLPRGDGDMLAYGLKSRIIFSIAPTATDSDSSEQLQGDLSVSLRPAELAMGKLSPGRTYRLEECASGPFMIRNTSDHTVVVALRAMSAASASATLQTGERELLNEGEIKIEPGTLTLEPGEERAITGTVTMTKKAPRGGNMMCVIAASVTDQPVQTQIYARLYARTR